MLLDYQNLTQNWLLQTFHGFCFQEDQLQKQKSETKKEKPTNMLKYRGETSFQWGRKNEELLSSSKAFLRLPYVIVLNLYYPVWGKVFVITYMSPPSQ